MANGLVSVWNLLGLVVLVVGLRLALRARATTPVRAADATPRSEPPDDLPPALAGALIHGRVYMNFLIGTVLDLARRGYLAIEPEDARGSARIRLLTSDLPEAPWERDVLQGLHEVAEADGTVPYRRIRAGRSRWRAVLGVLAADMVERGWFSSASANRRPLYAMLGFLFTVYGAILLLAATGGSTGYLLGGLAGAVGGLALSFFGRRVTNLTPEGHAAAAPWLDYREGLRAAAKDRADSLDLDRDIPYAVAFGVVPGLEARLQAAGEAGYRPVWLGQGDWSAHRSHAGFYPTWVSFDVACGSPPNAHKSTDGGDSDGGDGGDGGGE